MDRRSFLQSLLGTVAAVTVGDTAGFVVPKPSASPVRATKPLVTLYGDGKHNDFEAMFAYSSGRKVYHKGRLFHGNYGGMKMLVQYGTSGAGMIDFTELPEAYISSVSPVGNSSFVLGSPPNQ